jgi:hypothetical protein
MHGNFQILNSFVYQVKGLFFKRLNGRSQCKSYNWKGFKELVKSFEIAKPPNFMLSGNQRNVVCKASSFEKPGAVIPHAGICEGGSWVTGCSTLIAVAETNLLSPKPDFVIFADWAPIRINLSIKTRSARRKTKVKTSYPLCSSWFTNQSACISLIQYTNFLLKLMRTGAKKHCLR